MGVALPLGQLLGRIATIGQGAAKARDWDPSRPTESALGSATETLLGALPERERAALAERIDYLMGGADEVDAMLALSTDDGNHQSTQALPIKRAPTTSLG